MSEFPNQKIKICFPIPSANSVSFEKIENYKSPETSDEKTVLKSSSEENVGCQNTPQKISKKQSVDQTEKTDRSDKTKIEDGSQKFNQSGTEKMLSECYPKDGAKIYSGLNLSGSPKRILSTNLSEKSVSRKKKSCVLHKEKTECNHPEGGCAKKYTLSVGRPKKPIQSGRDSSENFHSLKSESIENSNSFQTKENSESSNVEKTENKILKKFELDEKFPPIESQLANADLFLGGGSTSEKLKKSRIIVHSKSSDEVTVTERGSKLCENYSHVVTKTSSQINTEKKIQKLFRIENFHSNSIQTYLKMSKFQSRQKSVSAFRLHSQLSAVFVAIQNCQTKPKLAFAVYHLSFEDIFRRQKLLLKNRRKALKCGIG